MGQDYQYRIAQHLAELFGATGKLDDQSLDAERTNNYPTQKAADASQRQELVRIATVDIENWRVLVQPLVVTYDGNVMVLAQNPIVPAYSALLVATAQHPLTGDCAVATFFGSVSKGGDDSEPVHVAVPLGAPNLPSVVTSFAGHLGLRGDAQTAVYSTNVFLNNQYSHGPQVYHMRAYPQGMDMESTYLDVLGIQMDMTVRDRIPNGTRLMLKRGPMTRGTYYTLNSSFTTIVASTNFISGLYVEAPIWLGA